MKDFFYICEDFKYQIMMIFFVVFMQFIFRQLSYSQINLIISLNEVKIFVQRFKSDSLILSLPTGFLIPVIY